MRADRLPGGARALHRGPGRGDDPGEAPEQIALLRLDTDWYESTRHELEHLYDRLSPGGVLIIDDYGHWQGVARRHDEFFERTGERLLLIPIAAAASRSSPGPDLPAPRLPCGTGAQLEDGIDHPGGGVPSSCGANSRRNVPPLRRTRRGRRSAADHLGGGQQIGPGAGS